jgi:hypothetical protein
MEVVMNSINDFNDMFAKASAIQSLFMMPNVKFLDFTNAQVRFDSITNRTILSVAEKTFRNFDYRAILNSQSAFSDVRRNVAVLNDGQLKVKNDTLKEIMGKLGNNQNNPVRNPENVDVEVVNERGQKSAGGRLGELTEAEAKVLDQALDKERTLEMTRIADEQVKSPEHDKTEVSSSSEATNTQAIPITKKAKNAERIGVIGASRESSKRDKYTEQLEARERAQEKREANIEYTEARDTKQDIINRDVEEHEEKQRNLKEDIKP